MFDIVASAVFCGRCQNVGRHESCDGFFGGRSESAPWMLRCEVEGLDSSERLHFGNLSLRMILRGQCSISCDLGS